jgi:TetR/AcrR family transcriptional regulator, regulator of cefoperazone and chloramphenicol sensitivity
MRQRDRETRERVLKAAAQLFADRGFKKVTVRDICRTARANVAAVNYHFGDKGGLYREVLQLATDTMRATSEAARAAGAGQPADERLRRYIQVSLCRVMKDGAASWISRLINREIADPTPAFDTLVEQGVRPRIDDLSAIVAEMLGCPVADERVPRCVASIHAQWILFVPNPIASRFRQKLHLRSEDVDRVGRHIADFSLAGIRAVGATDYTR